MIPRLSPAPKPQFLPNNSPADRLSHPRLKSSHPQAQLPTRRPGCYPVVTRMELRDRRHGGDAVATQLGQLLPFRRVDVDEAVHVPDTEALDAVARTLLPLRAQTFTPKFSHQQLGSRAWNLGGGGGGVFPRCDGGTYIVTHLPVWLLCRTVADGSICASVIVFPGPHVPIPSNEWILTVSS